MKLLSLLSLTLLIVAGLCVASPRVLAAEDPFRAACQGGNGTGSSSVCQSDNRNPLSGSDSLITKGTILVSTIVGVAAVVMIMIGGYKYIVSGGDPAKTASAKDTILYACIGLVIAVIARALTSFVVSKL